MDKSEICRLCALKRDELLYIYSEEGVKLSLENKIHKYLNLQVCVQSNLPTSVCVECCSQLNSFDKFVETTKSAQDTLKIIFPELNSAESPELPKSIDNTEDNVFSEVHGINIANEDDDDGKECEARKSSFAGSLERAILNDSSNEEDINCTDDADLNVDKISESPRKWLCCECSEELTDATELKDHHEIIHNQEVKYMCTFCPKLFTSYADFISHLRRHQTSFKYNCRTCGKGFTNRKVFEAHLLAHSDARHYFCQDCGKSFRQQSALEVHNRCHLPNDIKNKFICDICNKRFSSKPNLVTHKRIHAGVRDFTCDQCGKSFVQKGNLDAHLLTHSLDKPFSCELCNKKFKTGIQLKKHQSIHTGAKPHHCDVCGRTFREKGTLREHHRIHTGAMPFSCEFCGKSFRFKGILTTHRRQHTGERPYSCIECQHHFTNWPNYNKHMKRRHGVNTSRSTRVNAISVAAEAIDGQDTDTNPNAYQQLNAAQDLFQSQSPLSPFIYNPYSFGQVQIDSLAI